jgi:ferritin-like metal-binding protein YciE
MAAEKTLRELFHDTLKDIYFAEKKILVALPKMAKAAQSQGLKAAFEKHEAETEEHVARLEKVFSEIDAPARGKTCDAIIGIIDEGQEVMKEFKGTPALDAGLLAAAQAVEHYEITRYGALIAWAKELGHGEDATILTRNLSEEKAADKKLTALADRRVNPKSARHAGKSTSAGASHPRRAKAKPRRAAASRRKPAQKTKAARRRS